MRRNKPVLLTLSKNYRAMTNKTIYTLLTVLMTFNLWSQKQPGWEKAKSDLIKNESKLNHFLSNYGYQSTEGFKFSQKQDPYQRYSYYANNSLYRYIYEPDLIVYSFLAKAPKTASGDEYTFSLAIEYSRSKSQNRIVEPIDNYIFYGVSAAVHEYKGKDVNEAVLLKCLFNYTTNWNALNLYGDYDFSRIDSIAFQRNKNPNANSKSAQEYSVKLKGEGVKVWGDYEYSGVANLEVDYMMTIDQTNGKWEATHLRKISQDPVVTNEHVNPNYPPVNLAKDIGIEPLYKQYSHVDLKISSYRYLMDICRLIEDKLDLGQEKFSEVPIIKSLFSGEAGEDAINTIFTLKGLESKYYLTLDQIEVSDTYGRGVSTENENSIEIKFRYSRALSKDDVKKAKSEGASKEVLNVIKYPASGYIKYSVEIMNTGSKLNVKATNLYSQLVLKNGNNSKHPLK